MLKIHIPLFPSKYRQSANGGGRSPNKVSWRKNGSGRFAARRPSGGNSAMSHFCNDHFPSPGKQQQSSTVFLPAWNHISHFSNSLFLHKIVCLICSSGLAIAAFDRVKVAESRRETIVLTWFANFSPIEIIFPQREHFSYFQSGNIGHYSASCCCHDVTLLFRCFLFPPSTF